MVVWCVWRVYCYGIYVYCYDNNVYCYDNNVYYYGSMMCLTRIYTLYVLLWKWAGVGGFWVIFERIAPVIFERFGPILGPFYTPIFHHNPCISTRYISHQWFFSDLHAYTYHTSDFSAIFSDFQRTLVVCAKMALQDPLLSHFLLSRYILLPPHYTNTTHTHVGYTRQSFVLFCEMFYSMCVDLCHFQPFWYSWTILSYLVCVVCYWFWLLVVCCC